MCVDAILPCQRRALYAFTKQRVNTAGTLSAVLLRAAHSTANRTRTSWSGDLSAPSAHAKYWLPTLPNIQIKLNPTSCKLRLKISCTTLFSHKAQNSTLLLWTRGRGYSFNIIVDFIVIDIKLKLCRQSIGDNSDITTGCIGCY